MSESVISSAVVYCATESTGSISSQLISMPGCTLYREFSCAGKLVVVLEFDSTRATENTINTIEALPEVLQVRMVYNHIDTQEAMQEVIQDTGLEEIA